MTVRHAKLIDFLHRADKIDFYKSQWEKQKDGSWSKIVYTNEMCTVTEEYAGWIEHRVLKEGVSEKEYFKRILSDNI